MKRRLVALPLLTTAAALALAGTPTCLHAQQAIKQEAPKAVDIKAVVESKEPVESKGATVAPVVMDTPKRPRPSAWLMPGMRTTSDQGGPMVATLAAHAPLGYAEVFDYYAKKFGASNYDLKSLTTFQPPNHSLISGVGLNYDAQSTCYVTSQIMTATFCRRFAHELISVSLSTDKESHETYVSLTDATF